MLLKRLSRSISLTALVLGTVTALTGSQLCIKVLDETGSPIPSAHVRLFNFDSGRVDLRSTQEKGVACFLNIPEGVYSVEGSQQGFLSVKYYPLRVVYPASNELTVRLPLGEVSEGRVDNDVTLNGTLMRGNQPAIGVNICLITKDKKTIACVVTNTLGEYVLLIPPGIYQVELTSRAGPIQKSEIDLSAPGSVYHNRLSIDKGK